LPGQWDFNWPRVCPSRKSGATRALQLKLLAFGLLVVGDLAWLLLPPLEQDPWSEVLIVIAVWSAIVAIAWLSPPIGALLLFVGALFLGLWWAGTFLIVGFVAALGEDVGNFGAWAFWTFVWWVVLPMVAARLLVAAHRARRELEPIG
jgi:hypothetical protein